MKNKQEEETEFVSWAKRFESRSYRSFDVKEQKYFDRVVPSKCMYPVREGSHKRACLKNAEMHSPDGYLVCPSHSGKDIRPLWRGFVEGA